MNFVIWSHPWSLAGGGTIALHRLAHNIECAGHRSFLWTTTKNPEWRGTVIGQELPINIPNIIAIYPEVVVGNPFGATHVVRWLLNTPGVCGGDGNYQPEDLIFSYHASYKVPVGRELSGYLTAFRDLSHFRDLGWPRQGCCHMIRKGHRKLLDKHPPDSLFVDNYGCLGGDAFLIDVFNRRKQFICYDSATMTVVLAALCGCESIIVPDERTLDDFIACAGGWCNGVAWGPEDRPRAAATRHLIGPFAAAALDTAQKQTEAFVKICNERFSL